VRVVGGGSNGAITDQQIKAALDRAGMVAAGTHTGGLQSMVDPAYRQAQIEKARIYGYRMIGTAGNPGPGQPPSGLLADWQRWARQANEVGAALRQAGIKYFFHPEQDWSASSRTRRTRSFRACTGSIGSRTTPTRVWCSSSRTRCTRWPAEPDSSTRWTAACSTTTPGSRAWRGSGG
jgi:hypothetical protein